MAATFLLGTDAPTSPGYDVVLLFHVACALVGLATIVVSGLQSLRVRRSLGGGPPAPSLTRYFAPGINWAGRSIHGVPIFGVVLVALSGGAISLSDGWILAGFGLWASGAVVAEALLWPAERRIQAHLAGDAAAPDGRVRVDLSRSTGAVCLSALVVVVLFIVATVVMFVQP